MAHLEMNRLANNLTYLRKENGISKQELADIMGVGLWTVTKLERGELPPRMKVEALFRIQHRFGVSVHRLLGESLSKGE
ncbi:MAG: helix-turn-helix transcriptional regulator [Oscillospiraceae bacterium]|nr:helix-turn-helix transcriptional regulator [Oscillospiraceae bacterium]